MMDIAAIVPWLSAAALLISIGTAATTFFRAGTKEASAKLVEHERRIHTLEHELKHLPNIQLVHELQLSLKDIQMELAKVASSAEQSARTSSRVEAYLLEHGK